MGPWIARAAAGGLLLAALHAQTPKNTFDGIDVDTTSAEITMNVANRNGDLGIEAAAGVTDGGGNRARGNTNSLQCTGVVCS